MQRGEAETSRQEGEGKREEKERARALLDSARKKGYQTIEATVGKATTELKVIGESREKAEGSLAKLGAAGDKIKEEVDTKVVESQVSLPASPSVLTCQAKVQQLLDDTPDTISTLVKELVRKSPTPALSSSSSTTGSASIITPTARSITPPSADPLYIDEAAAEQHEHNDEPESDISPLCYCQPAQRPLQGTISNYSTSSEISTRPSHAPTNTSYLYPAPTAITCPR